MHQGPGEIAAIYAMRESDPLVTATPKGARVVVELLRSFRSGGEAWNAFWRSSPSPGGQGLAVVAAAAYAKALKGVPVDQPVSADPTWPRDPITGKPKFACTVGPEYRDEFGVGIGDSVNVVPSKAAIRAIKNARVPRPDED